MWCAALSARGSGFYFGDNGAKAMVQGGAFTAQADDLTAMQYNPAGLTALQGYSFLADLNVLRHDVTFWRQDLGFDPASPSTLATTVGNTPSPFLVPFLGVGFGAPVFGRRLTVALGVMAPPSQGRNQFPAPNTAKKDDGTFVASPSKYAPQRYALISNDIVIAYPTLSLAYEVHPRFQVGLSAQLVVSRFAQSQSLYGGDTLGLFPQTLAKENPDYDATVAIDLPGETGFTGILGVMARPTDWLSLGASVRPPIPFKARGAMRIGLSDYFQKNGAKVEGDSATLTMTLPLEVRFGARVTPFSRLGINFDVVYQGWNSVDQLLVTPENASLLYNEQSTPIAPVAVKKNWLPVFSARLGASVRVFQFLSLSGGALFETGAAPTSTFSVDWSHPTRFIFTAGATGHLGPVDVIVGGMWTPVITTVITDSQVQRGQTTEMSPGIVGNGMYTSGGYGLIFGVRGHFGGVPQPQQSARTVAVKHME
jgi:long-chain fatty acid transport protein